MLSGKETIFPEPNEVVDGRALLEDLNIPRRLFELLPLSIYFGYSWQMCCVTKNKNLNDYNGVLNLSN